MQDYKTATNQKGTNVKSTFGSPSSKIKSAASPKASVAASKSPANAHGIKVGQWKTSSNLNSVQVRVLI